MEVAIPISGAAMDCYEDMFKEITRKLYGEDGLPELNVGERISANIPERNTITDYEVDNPILKSEEHLTAFGLAALMQNGFPTNSILNTQFNSQPAKVEDSWTSNEESLHWTHSKIANYNPSQKLFRCAECDCVGILTRVAEHWLGTHSNIRAFRCPQCPYESAWARCVRMHLSRQHNIETDESNDTLLKNNPVVQEITKYLQNLKTKLDTNCTKAPNEDYNSSNSRSLVDQATSSGKRYSCTYCPYATDRRDLFTRHENIHREEKPFQCYVCQKQFNRADHVKKHFLRMHREHPYDLNRIRRHPPKNASGMSYYQKYNAAATASNTQTESINSLSIPSGFQGITRQTIGAPLVRNDNKSKNGIISKNSKKKGEKRFTCCYCSWSGVDNWCLKRHMNTHLKPFICSLCDYKAARSERLATHVLKVHNKRACGKCNFLADEPAQLIIHQQEHHPLEHRNRNNNNSILRNPQFNSNPSSSASCSQSAVSKSGLTSSKPWKNHTAKQHGAARLFSYMEASDGSEPESDSRTGEDLGRINQSHRIQTDFPEAGDVGERAEEYDGQEIELPLFVCPICGCEFEDDSSLEIHQYTHRHSTTSPAKSDFKENMDPSPVYRCHLCDAIFEKQLNIINHLTTHSSLENPSSITSMRSNRRKQSRPQRLIVPYWDSAEVEVLRHLNRKLRRWRTGTISFNVKLADKYMAQLVTKHGLFCFTCNKNNISRYHTRTSLSFHRLWRHSLRKFKCEHCELRFKHRYQVVLHSGRAHVKKQESHHAIHRSENIRYPTSAPLDSNIPLHPSTVPEVSCVPKLSELGMSFLDHPFAQNNSSINHHIPIIIPTFPPN